MIIDVFFVLLMIYAIIKGYRNGFVIAIFSFFGIIIGLAAAMKFSTLVADWLKNSTHISIAWLPFLSFLIVMIGILILVRLTAKLIHTAMELVLLGWLNKLSGMLLYATLFVIMYSVLLFYAVKLHFCKEDTLLSSVCYSFIQPWGPKAIGLFGTIIPLFDGMFEELSDFFENNYPHAK